MGATGRGVSFYIYILLMKWENLRKKECPKCSNKLVLVYTKPRGRMCEKCEFYMTTAEFRKRRKGVLIKVQEERVQGIQETREREKESILERARIKKEHKERFNL